MPEQLSKSLYAGGRDEPHLVLVIGAGLAGACAARALALQGFSVLVLDAADSAAQGASALPVGLMAPRKGKNKKENSASSSPVQGQQPDWDGAGMVCTRSWLEALSQTGQMQRGQDWQACGSAEWREAATAPSSWHWQPEACWVKPQRLVAACLQQAGIVCRWRASVHSLRRQTQGWQVMLDGGEAVQAAAVVLATSVATQTLLPSLADLPAAQSSALLQRLRQKKILNATAGQAIYAPWESEWQKDLPLRAEHGAHACNGHGHFVPGVPWEGQNHGEGAAFWLSGATYVHQASAAAADSAEGQQENLQRVAELQPSLAARFNAQAQQGRIQRFVGVRCTTPTRQPVLGHLGADLWVLAGLGSRGLSYAPLAATWLAEQMRKGG